jgi:hypothetical protein
VGCLGGQREKMPIRAGAKYMRAFGIMDLLESGRQALVPTSEESYWRFLLHDHIFDQLDQ